jgi:phospholipase C
MSDLVNSLDFNNPDYSVPVLPTAGSGALTTGVAGLGTLLDVSSILPLFLRCILTTTLQNTACLALYPNGAPDVPYGTQTEATALAVEAGSRAVRGYLTEGRHLVFVSYTSSHALAYDPTHKSAVTAAPATPIHSEPNQRLVAHYSAGTPSPNSPFKLVFSAAPVGQGYLTATGAVGSLAQAADWTITPTTTGYTISSGNVNLGTTATGLTTSGAGDKFKIVSVTY